MNENMSVIDAIDFILNSYILPDEVYDCLEEYKNSVSKNN